MFLRMTNPRPQAKGCNLWPGGIYDFLYKGQSYKLLKGAIGLLIRKLQSLPPRRIFHESI